MKHPLPMTHIDRYVLERAIYERLQTVDFRKYGEESNYNPALVHALSGFEFKGKNFHLTIDGAPMTSDSKHSAESHVGADMGISAEIWVGDECKKKAVLIQAKRKSKLRKTEELERLKGQIKKMQRFTKHPKVLVIDDEFNRVPVILSGATLLAGGDPREIGLDSWLARRFVRTFDGDRNPTIVKAAQDPNLDRIWLKAEFPEI